MGTQRLLFACLLSSLLLLTGITASAQKGFTVKGTVKDLTGAPLQGVTVRERYTNIRTQTSANGDYSITVKADTAQLLFTYVGMQGAFERIAGRSTINVVMTPTDNNLNDVVVIGYNTGPVVPGKGSAIFLHCARPDFSPTEGCIAVARDALASLLGLLGPGSTITIRA